MPMARLFSATSGHLPARQVVLHVKMKIAPKTETDFPVGGDEVIERAVQAGGEFRQGSKDYIAAQKIAACGEHIFVWGIAYYCDGYGERPIHPLLPSV